MCQFHVIKWEAIEKDGSFCSFSNVEHGLLSGLSGLTDSSTLSQFLG